MACIPNLVYGWQQAKAQRFSSKRVTCFVAQYARDHPSVVAGFAEARGGIGIYTMER